MSYPQGNTPSPLGSVPTPPMTINNGPIGASISSVQSPSGYTVVANSAIATGSQKRPGTAGSSDSEVLDRKRLQELVKEVDPNEQLDEDVETMLLQIADDFIEQVSFYFQY